MMMMMMMKKKVLNVFLIFEVFEDRPRHRRRRHLRIGRREQQSHLRNQKSHQTLLRLHCPIRSVLRLLIELVLLESFQEIQIYPFKKIK